MHNDAEEEGGETEATCSPEKKLKQLSHGETTPEKQLKQQLPYRRETT